MGRSFHIRLVRDSHPACITFPKYTRQPSLSRLFWTPSMYTVESSMHRSYVNLDDIYCRVLTGLFLREAMQTGCGLFLGYGSPRHPARTRGPIIDISGRPPSHPLWPRDPHASSAGRLPGICPLLISHRRNVLEGIICSSREKGGKKENESKRHVDLCSCENVHVLWLAQPSRDEGHCLSPLSP